MTDYNLNIPATNNSPSQDQPDMLENTNAISAILNVDMIGFNQANSGFHNKITYVDQSSDPGSDSQQYVTYSKLTNSSSELYAQKDGTSTPIQLTRGTPSLPSGNTAGLTYLPGGLYLLYGEVNVNPSGTLNFPVTLSNLLSFSATSDQPVALYKTSSNSNVTSITVSRVSGSGSAGAYIVVIGN